jgi:hypothetical protein
MAGVTAARAGGRPAAPASRAWFTGLGHRSLTGLGR